jgi:hypothetical protein
MSSALISLLPTFFFAAADLTAPLLAVFFGAVFFADPLLAVFLTLALAMIYPLWISFFDYTIQRGVKTDRKPLKKSNKMLIRLKILLNRSKPNLKRSKNLLPRSKKMLKRSKNLLNQSKSNLKRSNKMLL